MKDIPRTAEIVFFTTILLLASGAFAPLWTDTASHDVASGGLALEVVWSGVYLVMVMLALRNRRAVIAQAANLKWIALLVALCFLSALWSASTTVSLRKAVAILGTTLTGVVFAMRFDVRQQVRIIAGALTIAAVASILAMVGFGSAFPPTEIASGAWNGVFSHKNLLGRSMSLAAVAFCVLGLSGVRNSVLSIAGSMICITLILASHSQTALVVCVACVALLCVVPILRAEWRQAIGILLLTALIAAPLVAYGVTHNQELTSILARDATLTGRSRIWDFAWLSWTQRPWLGYGYGGFWWVAPESQQALALIGYPTPNSHNGFLELALQLGVTGLGVFLAGWIAMFTGAVRHFRQVRTQDSRWPFIYLVFLLLYSFTESSLLVPNSILWILYIAVGTTLCRSSRTPQTPNVL